MGKDVSIPTFTIQYLMESGQGLTSNTPSAFRIPHIQLNPLYLRQLRRNRQPQPEILLLPAGRILPVKPVKN